MSTPNVRALTCLCARWSHLSTARSSRARVRGLPASIAGWRTRESRYAALALLLAALALLQPTIAAAAPATVCVVGGACHGADLKAAIAAAGAGAVIEIGHGEVTQAGIAIDKNLTIRGEGASSVVQAAATPRTATDRVFVVAAGVTATLQDLKVRHGQAQPVGNGGNAHPESGGGGILNQGTLTLLRVTVSDNATRDEPAVVYSPERENGRTAGSGGGIYNNGTLTVAQSTISGNVTGNGGALTECAHFGCSGGIGGHGGAILNHDGRLLTIVNSTLSGNQTGHGGGCGPRCFSGSPGGGGALLGYSGHTAALNNVTVTGNRSAGTGGIRSFGNVTLRNSILLGNVDDFGTRSDCGGTTSRIVSQGHNVFHTNAGCPANAGAGDVESLNVADVLAAALADNGGSTQTHALATSSPAIDNGNSAAPGGSDPGACTETDQRGRGRAGACDSGAFEHNGVERRPAVTIEQASGQADPTTTGPIRFVATFSAAVTGFTPPDLLLGGTAGATTVVVTETEPGTTYDIAVSGMVTDGIVTISLAADKAIDAFGNGNSASTGDNSVTYATDKTPPVITPIVTGTLGNNGWYRSNVTVGWSVTDAESSVVSSPCSSTTILADAAGVTATCSATSAGGSSSNSVTVKRDATPPTLAPSVSPNPVSLNGSALATASAADVLSGLASQSCGTPDTSSAGSKTVTCSATDQAGNTTTAGASYSVSGFAWSGFHQPVDNPPTINRAKAGSAIPVKFSLGGNYGLAIFASGYPISRPSAACSSSAPVDEIETVSAGSSGLSYDAATGQYTYPWKTQQGWAGTCRELVVKLVDGIERSATFSFK